MEYDGDLIGGDWNMAFMTVHSSWEFHHPN